MQEAFEVLSATKKGFLKSLVQISKPPQSRHFIHTEDLWFCGLLSLAIGQILNSDKCFRCICGNDSFFKCINLYLQKA